MMQNMLKLERLKHKPWQLETRHGWSTAVRSNTCLRTLHGLKTFCHEGRLSLGATQPREKLRAYP